MHRIDQLELFNTLLEIRAEAKWLLGNAGSADRSLALRRILALLGYMAEHLEMMGGESHGTPDRPRQGTARRHQ